MSNRLYRFVSEGDVEGLSLVRTRADECGKRGYSLVVLATSPDGVHVGGDVDQLGEVTLERAVVI